MLENGMFWSVRENLDGLLECLRLKKLPKLVDEKMAIV